MSKKYAKHTSNKKDRPFTTNDIVDGEIVTDKPEEVMTQDSKPNQPSNAKTEQTTQSATTNKTTSEPDRSREKTAVPPPPPPTVASQPPAPPPSSQSKLPLALSAIALLTSIYAWYQAGVIGKGDSSEQASKVVGLEQRVSGLSDSTQNLTTQVDEVKNQLLTAQQALGSQVIDTKSALTNEFTDIKQTFGTQLTEVQQSFGNRYAELNESVNSQYNDLQSKVVESRQKLDSLLVEAKQELVNYVDETGENHAAKLADYQAEYKTLEEAVNQATANVESRQQALVMTEVNQLIDLADKRLRLAGDVEIATTALALADERLQSQQDADLIALREVIAADMAKISSTSAVDVENIVTRLANLSTSVSQWPMLGDNAGTAEADPVQPAASGDAGGSGLLSIGKSLINDIGSKIKVKVNDNGAPILPTDQRYFITENAKLMLNGAQLGLLREQQDVYSQNLSAVTELVNLHFDPESEAVTSGLAELAQLSEVSVVPEPVDIAATLDAMQALAQ